PEQIEKPQEVDHRADIYSLGVVFYEMLTGELPLGRFAAPSKKVQIDVRLDDIVLRALEKEPALRYQQAVHVSTAVETCSSQPPPLSSPTAAPRTTMNSRKNKFIWAGGGFAAAFILIISLTVLIRIREAR